MGNSSLLSSFISKFIFMNRSFGKRAFRLLDVGAGNHSASKTLDIFPNCAYYGLDLDKSYNYDEDDFKLMKGFYEMDLTKLAFGDLPQIFFDGIWIVHVIEHLHNGDEVLVKLLPKLKSGGYMYIEYPGIKSTTLPSMPGSLNFNDDASHVRLYSIKELSGLLQSHGCRIVKAGTRRNVWFMLAMPFRIGAHLLKGKKIQGNIFWDVAGFAEYMWLQKL
ncbi:MAG: methyltransferase domain-containing protein [Ferruginibacter sp.]